MYKQWLSRLWRGLSRLFVYVTAVSIVLLAVILSLLRTIQPDLGPYLREIEQQAGTVIKAPLSIERIDVRMQGLTPTAIFKSVSVLDPISKVEIFHVGEVKLGLAIMRSLVHWRLAIARVTLSGVDIDVGRDKEGRFLLQGFTLPELKQGDGADTTHAAEKKLAQWFFNSTDILIEDASLHWLDQKGQIKPFNISDLELKLRNSGNRHQITGRTETPNEWAMLLGFAMDINGDMLEPKDWDARFNVEVQGAQLDLIGLRPAFQDYTLRKADADVQLWAGWSQGRLTDISSLFAISKVTLGLPGKKSPASLSQLSGAVRWLNQDHGWAMQVANFSVGFADATLPLSSFMVQDSMQADAHHLDVFAAQVEIDKWITLANKLRLPNQKLERTLAEYAPRGRVSELNLHMILAPEGVHDYALTARLEQLAVNPVDKNPGVSNLSGSLWANQSGGTLLLDSRDTSLKFSSLFRRSIDWTHLSGRVDWLVTSQMIAFQTQHLRMSNPDAGLRAHLALWIPASKGSPYMDLQVRVDNLDVSRVPNYLPAGIMSQGLIKWIDENIIGGDVKQGVVVFNGRLSDFPFSQNAGSFMVQFEGNDVAFDYLHDWPGVTHAKVDASFTGLGMSLHVTEAQLLGSAVRDLAIDIDEFSTPLLRVTGVIDSSTRDAVHFLVDSRIAEGARSLYETSVFYGGVTTHLRAVIPLDASISQQHPLEYDGKIDLQGAGLSVLQGAVDVRDAKGQVSFSQVGERADNIQAQLMGRPATFAIFTSHLDEKNILHISAQSELDTGQLQQRFDLPLLDKIKGVTPLNIMLTPGYRINAVDVPTTLGLYSSLDNVSVDLPAPVGKGRERLMDFSLGVGFLPNSKTMLDIQYGNIFKSRLLLKSSNDKTELQRGHLRFSTSSALLPDTDVMRVSGVLTDIDASAWSDALAGKKDSKSTPFALPIDLALDYLGIEEKQKETDPAKKKVIAHETALPTSFPLVSGAIEHFRYADVPLGRLQFKTSRTVNGLHVDEMKLRTDNYQLQGHGNWTYSFGRHKTEFEGSVTSTDLGGALTALKYAAIIHKGDANANFNLKWNAPPTDFEFSRLDGNFHFEIKNGSIVEVDPGVGKLFGLLSLADLPRRLTLDFSDIFGSGFSFNTITGDFSIQKGDARTDNLVLTSPIASVGIKGRMGLAAEDFDQEVIVVPKISDTLVTIGLLTGGTQVGLVAYLINKLIGKDVDQSISNHYHIGGTWAKPEIVPIKDAKEGSEPATGK